jgi:hypothetical protein
MANFTLNFPFIYAPLPNADRAITIGSLYVGIKDGDPLNQPAERVAVFAMQPDGTEVPLVQPISLGAGGVPLYNGTPVQLKVNVECSVAVTNNIGAQVYYTPRFLTYEASLAAALAAMQAEIDALQIDVAQIIGDIAVAKLDSIQALRDIVNNPGYEAAIVANYYDDAQGGGGVWTLDAADTTSADNGGTVIVDGDAKRWKLLHNGEVSIMQFGFKPDWNGTTGTDNTEPFRAMIADVNIKKITGYNGSFYFGSATPNIPHIPVTRNIEIDWYFAKLFINQAALGNISTAFIETINTTGFVMCNFEFTDLDYSEAGVAINNRGIHPFCIITSGAAGASGVIEGNYRAGNYIVHKGQSLYCISALNAPDFGVNYSKGFETFGDVVGVDTYYGGVHFYSGSSSRVRFRLGKFVRAIIINDCFDIKADIRTDGDNVFTSSCLLLTANGFIDMRDIEIKAWMNTDINGPVRLSAPDAAGAAATYKNVKLDLFIKGPGPNINPINGALVTISAFNSGGVYIGAGTLTVQDCSIKVVTDNKTLQDVFLYETRSPNVKRVFLDTPNYDPTSIFAEKTITQTKMGTVVGYRGNLFSSPLIVSMGDVLGFTIGPKPFYVEVDVIRFRSSAPTIRNIEKFFVWGSLSSGGLSVIEVSTRVANMNAGFGNDTVFTLAPFGAANISITSASSGSSDDRTVVTFRPVGSLVRMF